MLEKWHNVILEQETIDSAIRSKLMTEHGAFKNAQAKAIDLDESQHSSSEDEERKSEDVTDQDQHAIEQHSNDYE